MTHRRRAVATVSLMLGWLMLCVADPFSSADDKTGLQTVTDQSLFPQAYGILGNEHLMFPVDMSDWPVKIDSSHQLFVDDYLIASTENIRRTVHQAKK